MTPLRGLVHLSDQIAATSAASVSKPDSLLLHKIADLETSLGIPLLVHRSQRLSLTPAGEDLVAFARRTITGLSEMTPRRQSEPLKDLPERRFITPEVETDSIELVDQIMKFCMGLARARSSFFFWVGPNCEIVDARCQNIERELISNYLTEMCEYDPLHIAKLKSRGQLIATLSTQQAQGFAAGQKYRDYCNAVGVGDEIDMLFWRNGRPFACLAMFRSPDAPPFSLSEMDWEAMRRHVQASLQMHWRVRSDEVGRILSERYGLQPREMDVVELILQGKSNADISDILLISIATVKVHVVNILKKLGVDSRLAVACVISRLHQS
jgi:DNA-binding CsgD family transcriptional regulator